MINANMPSYKRAPSSDFMEFLKEGLLSPLMHLGEGTIAGRHHDVHLRIGDEVHVYTGLTRLVTAKLRRDRKIQVSAHRTYADQTCAEGLFRIWSEEDDEDRSFASALGRYLEQVCVASRHTGERRWRPDHLVACDIAVDTLRSEAVLSYENEQQASNSREFAEVEQARFLLKTIAAERPGRRGQRWQEPSSSGEKLDQLAVDEKGNLVLIELKHAARDGNSAEIYYSPLQLLQYIHEWNRALGSLSIGRDLQELIDARVVLGLMPEVPQLSGRLRAAVCFGNDGRTEEVKRRYYETLGIVNAHLPSDVGPIETWKFEDGGEPEAI